MYLLKLILLPSATGWGDGGGFDCDNSWVDSAKYWMKLYSLAIANKTEQIIFKEFYDTNIF